MSWSGNCQDVGERVDAESFSAFPPEPWADEVAEQIAEALNVAQSVIDSGAIGSGPYIVSLGGHANPNHEPAEGWANDYVSISITQKTKAVAADV